MALRKEADPEIEALADFTGGKAFFVPDHDTCDALGDAFRGSLTFQPYVKSENVLVKVVSFFSLQTTWLCVEPQANFKFFPIVLTPFNV